MTAPIFRLSLKNDLRHTHNQFSSLTTLKIIGSKQSEEELLQLKNLQNIRALDLSEAENLTDEVAAELFGENTHITIATLLRCPKFTDQGLLKLSATLEVTP